MERLVQTIKVVIFWQYRGLSHNDEKYERKYSYNTSTNDG